MQEDASKPPRRGLPTAAWIAIGCSVLVFGVLVLGILATVVVPNVLKRFKLAQGEKARADITAIESALLEYNEANAGEWPDSLEALVTPDVNGSTFFKRSQLPKDPWGNEYLFDPPESGRPIPRVYTYGKDGRAGGEGEAADIDNFTIRDNR